MDTAVEILPDDPVLLRSLLLTLMAEREAERAEKQQLIDQNARLEQMLALLRRMQFGKRSEKLDPDQFNLAFEDLEQAVASAVAEEEKRNPEYKRARTEKRRAGRGSLPDHLPRIDVVIEPEESACPCCGGALHIIGEDQSQRLDVIPAQYQVIVTHRPKYACRACEGTVLQAAAPAHLIEGGLPTERLVASVLVAKYADHTPLYRQAQILARQGITLERKTLAYWVGYGAAELKPLWRLIRDDLLASTRLFVDETTAPVLDPGRGRTKTGYFWVIARDDRPWGGGDPPAVIYNYAPGRGGKHLNPLLSTFSGVLQADGYQVYKSFALKHDGVTVAHCWAHARRLFFDVAKPSPIAEEALGRVAALYHIEAEIRGHGAEIRHAVRQEQTKPLIDALEVWCRAKLASVSGKSAIAAALRYTLNQWDGLVRFLDDGRIEMDNNTVERCMRPIALNRKNALFAGHDEGAENWAMIASLIETCKLNGVNPQTYLTDVLTKLVNNWPNSRLAELTPWAWAAQNPL